MVADLELCAKLAAVAYALPYFLTELSSIIHLPAPEFNARVAQVVSTQLVHAFTHMKKPVPLTLSDQCQMAGFYLRTPVRMWDANGNWVSAVPQHKCQLLDRLVLGNVNLYVLRMSTGLYVLFRGTSNPFNGVQQYGYEYNNTPVFKEPGFDIRCRARTSGPRFYSYYVLPLLDVKRFIYSWVDKYPGVPIYVLGHSMGGALTHTFAYMALKDRPDLFRRMNFRSFAAPYCCSEEVVDEMRGQLQPEQFVDVLNSADMVNIRHALGYQAGFKKSIRGGLRAVGRWLLHRGHLWSMRDHQATILRALHIYQRRPEEVRSVFVHGALQSQTPAKRMGKPVRRHNEPPERAHSVYLGIDMNVLWSPTRAYEEMVYSEPEHQLHTLPLFPKRDLDLARSWNLECSLFRPDHRLISEVIGFQTE